MEDEIVKKICRYGAVRTYRRSEYVECNNNEANNFGDCKANVHYCTGHAMDDTRIDLEFMYNCPFREAEKVI